jgi:hypothetical protein
MGVDAGKTSQTVILIGLNFDYKPLKSIKAAWHPIIFCNQGSLPALHPLTNPISKTRLHFLPEQPPRPSLFRSSSLPTRVSSAIFPRAKSTSSDFRIIVIN